MYVFENFLNIHSVDLWNRYITDSIAKRVTAGCDQTLRETA